MTMSVGSRPQARPSLATFVDIAVGSHSRAAVLLIALSLLAFLPGFFIFLTSLCFNLVGNGLRDALDPRLNK